MLDLEQILDLELAQPVKTYLEAPNPTTDGLVHTLDVLSETTGPVTGGQTADGKQIRFDLNFDYFQPPFDVGIGTVTSHISAFADAHLDFGLGLDLTKPLTGGQAFFVEVKEFVVSG